MAGKVKGLKETRRALVRLPRDLDRAVDDTLTDEAKRLRNEGRRVAPNVHPSAPSSTAWIQASGPSVVVDGARNPRALATEFGMDRPSRGRRRTGRRQFNRNRESGYVIGPIMKDLRKTDDEVADDSAKQMRKTMDRAGVPRG